MDTHKALDLTSVPVTDPASVPSVYSNNASIAVSPWDLRLIFTEIILPYAGDAAAIEMRANVVMNPSHAKALLTSLEPVRDFA